MADTLPLVLVTWEDAEDTADGKTWMDDEEVKTFSQQSCTVVSIGFLISKTTKYVTLAGDYIEKLGHYGRVTKIPAGMVVQTEVLVVK